MQETDVRDALARENPEYRDLATRHQAFESRLLELRRKSFLNPQEELEQVNIKKHKLLLKDRMAELVRRARGGPGHRC